MRRDWFMVVLIACSDEPQTVIPDVEPTETVAPVETPTLEQSTPTPMINPPVTGECPGDPPVVPLDLILAGWGY